VKEYDTWEPLNNLCDTALEEAKVYDKTPKKATKTRSVDVLLPSQEGKQEEERA
jgi:hypothetical protein